MRRMCAGNHLERLLQPSRAGGAKEGGEIETPPMRCLAATWRSQNMRRGSDDSLQTVAPTSPSSSSEVQKDRMSSEAPDRMVKLSYKQLVTMRLLLLHAGTNLAMCTNELERGNVGSLLISKRTGETD
jgi:hypothetical protein